MWAFVETAGAVAPVRFDYLEGGPVGRIVVGGRCPD
jgi:hypothetical protein